LDIQKTKAKTKERCNLEVLSHKREERTGTKLQSGKKKVEKRHNLFINLTYKDCYCSAKREKDLNK